jgi:signal transduction histidine kinase/streptogramin lyase
MVVDLINLIAKTGHFLHHQHKPLCPNSLNNDHIFSLYQDRAGTLWVGTNGGGLNQFNRAQQKFSHYFPVPNNPNTLNNKDVFAIYEDREGILWVGTETGGLNKFDRQRQKVTHYLNDPENPNSLSHNEVQAIYEDSNGVLWIGTYGGGLNRFNRQHFVSYKNDPDNPNSLNDNYVMSIHEDKNKTLWIGTRKGLNQYDRQLDKFVVHYYHDPQNPYSLSHGEVSVIYEDYSGMLWIGTPGGGLNKIDLQTKTGLPGSLVRYQHDTQNPTSLSNDEILSIHEDATGTLWIGTSGGGLNQFDRETQTFTHYKEEDGLANDTVYGILEDEQGYLWLSTNKGLSKFNPKTKIFRNYDVADGLQSNEFNINAYHKSRRGELFFGGINGFNVFDPLKVKDNPYIPPIVITEFKIFNQPVSFKEHSPLQQHISETHAITLSYKQSFFSFEFAALNFLQPEKNQYAYKLEGFDQSWNEIGTQRHTNYTYMPHGTYLFRVKGSNNDKVWNEKGTAITITILPPPWKTWWAYTLYAFTILTIIGNYIRTQKQKLWAKQQELEREQKISAQLKEADKLKDEFLANTSHELRTPLNGIIGIAESLVDGAAGQINQQLRSNLAMIVSSGRRLFSLVNDILDFSQLKQKQINLQIKAVDIRTIADVVLTLTQPLIGSKKLSLSNAIPSELPPINADENRVQQILYNLVGNAIKFTDRGRIKISAKIIKIAKKNLESIHNEANGDKVLPLEKWLAITVSDTGIGVSPEKWDRIFKAFEQADGGTARIYGGTGLGLAVTQQLVQLHGGKMSVQSQPGVGSQFTFTLPLSSQSVTSYQLSEPPLISQAEYKVPLHPELLLETKSLTTESKLQPTEQKSRLQPTAENSGLQLIEETGKFTILVVDDDLVNRQVLVNHLSLHNYTIHQTASGMETLAYFEKKNKPDLILLDVMMPKINGYEVTRKIRETWQADELPIILLTAKDQVADLVVGLESGANDYLTKPVYKDELLARIKTHVHILQLQAVRKKAERLQKEYNQTLTREVAKRTQALRESEAQLRLAKDAADVANRAKSTFLANMSHELRTPLNAILGFTQVMQRSQSLSLEHQNWVKIIYNSGEYLLSLINDVLDMSKIEAGKITLDEQDFDLHSLLDEVHNLFYLKAKDKHLQCLVKRHDNVPHYIHTDSKKLRQILINLFSNAIKFTQTGGVYLYVEKISPKEETDADEKITLHFKVEDTGAGVAEEELNKLFDPFSQTMTGRASQEGTGLGLPISRQFIELMSGDISVQSQIGKGTVFQFTIRAPIVKMVKNVNTPPHQIIALEANQPHYRILIVDDKMDNRQLLIQLLSPLGFELREAGNGEQAINIFENWQPHLIWMDIQIPIMDGYQATQHIKAKKSDVVIIALTAGTFEKEPEKALSAGCDDFLRKPFRETEIFDLMSKHLGVRYVYEKTVNLPETIKINREVLTPTALAALPNELLSELENAATSCDMEMINLIIDKIFMHNADLANALETLASDFRYEEISALIISRKGQPQGIAPTI